MWEPKSISRGISTIGKDRLEILLFIRRERDPQYRLAINVL